MSSDEGSSGESSAELSVESFGMPSSQGSNNQSFLLKKLESFPTERSQSPDLLQLVVSHGGMFITDPVKTVAFKGGERIFIHNVDPTKFKLARLLQLVLKEQDDPEQIPARMWYTEYGSQWPHCIKPLHTASHFREMVANCMSAGTNWGRVYIQFIEELIGADGNISYSMPLPLSLVRPFEGMENLYDHAKYLQGTIDLMLPATRRRLEAARIWPYVSRP